MKNLSTALFASTLSLALPAQNFTLTSKNLGGRLPCRKYSTVSVARVAT